MRQAEGALDRRRDMTTDLLALHLRHISASLLIQERPIPTCGPSSTPSSPGWSRRIPACAPSRRRPGRMPGEVLLQLVGE